MNANKISTNTHTNSMNETLCKANEEIEAAPNVVSENRIKIALVSHKRHSKHGDCVLYQHKALCGSEQQQQQQ